jgi:glycosyltransferase involved in cell wall biosynthesis
MSRPSTCTATPVVVTDRAGVAGSFRDGEAIVVPETRDAVVGAIARVLGDAELRATLAAGGVTAARRNSWDRVAELQEEIYRAAASRTDSTNASTDGA